MGGGFKLRRAPRKPQDDTHGSMRPEGALGSSKRTPVNVADCRGKIVFKVKKILAVQLRNSESFYHIEWENIPVNTWEPSKHLQSDDGRAAIQAWELQSAVCVDLALLVTCSCF
jgi:hypothetical protein